MRIKDVYLENVQKEEEYSSSLPVYLQIVQNTVRDYEQALGTIGNNNYAYTIELPDKNTPSNVTTSGIEKLKTILESYKVLKISRKDLFEDFYIYPIIDYGNQSMTKGILDFIPICFKDGKKIWQNHIGLIRAYASKKAYIIIDKTTSFKNSDNENPVKLYENIGSINVLIKFRSYYDKGNKVSFDIDNNRNYLEDLSPKFELDTTGNRYKGTFKVLLSKLSKYNFEELCFIASDDYNKYKYVLNNSELIKNIKLESIKINKKDDNETVSRQDSSSNNDYYKKIMAFVYDRIKTQKPNTTPPTYDEYHLPDVIYITVSIDNIFEDLDVNTISCQLSNVQSNLFVYNEDEFKKHNFTSLNQFIIYEYGNPGLNFFGITKTCLDKDVILNDSCEILPLNSEDLIYMIKAVEVTAETTGNININIHKFLKERNFYAPYVDLSKANIYCYTSEGIYKKASISNEKGSINNLLPGDSVIISVNQLIPEITEDLSDTTKALVTNGIANNENISKLLVNIDNIPEDPYLYSNSKVVENNVSSDDDVFLYDGELFENVENCLTDDEPYVLPFESEVGIKVVPMVKHGNIKTHESLKSSVLTYSYHIATLDDKINNLYDNIVAEKYKKANDINNNINTFKKSLLRIYNNEKTTYNQETNVNVIDINGGYMFLGITLNTEEEYFDLFIESNEKILYIERNAQLENKNYIHIPFYDTFNKTIKCVAKDMSGNVIPISKYLVVK